MVSEIPTSMASRESDDFSTKTSAIRRSMRCLVFGMMGFVPVLGIAIAIQAAVLHHRLARETGETWQPWQVPVTWLIQAVVFVLIVRLPGMPLVPLAAAMAILYLPVLGGLFLANYHRAKPSYWNGARRSLWFGGFLAWAGISFFSQIILAILANLYLTMRDFH